MSGTNRLKMRLSHCADQLGLTTKESRKKLLRVLVLAGSSALGGAMLTACGEDTPNPTPTGVEFGVPNPDSRTGDTVPEQMSCRDYCSTVFSANQGDEPGSWGCWEARENGQPIPIDEPIGDDQTSAESSTEATNGSSVQFVCAKRDGYVIDRVGPGTGYGVCAEFDLECDHTKDEHGYTADCGFGHDEGDSFSTKCVVPDGRDM